MQSLLDQIMRFSDNPLLLFAIIFAPGGGQPLLSAHSPGKHHPVGRLPLRRPVALH